MPTIGTAVRIATRAAQNIRRFGLTLSSIAERVETGQFASRGPPYSEIRLNRKALPMTDTELNVIAALAIIGLSSSPMNG